MFSRKTNNKNSKKNILSLQHTKITQVKNHLNNNSVKKRLMKTGQWVNDKQKIILLKVIENKQQLKIVQSPSSNLIEPVNQSPTIDIQLEHFKAPTHVLDHSYAINKNPEADPLYIDNNIQNNNIQTVQNDNLQINLKPAHKKLNNFEDQTNEKSSKEIIAELRGKLGEKKTENQVLQKRLEQMQQNTEYFAVRKVKELLKSIFSPTQIDKLLSPHKVKIKWTTEDIISAVTLQNISLKAYNYLRDNNYPLPGSSTVRKWTCHINLTEGLMKEVLTIMKLRSKTLSVFQKIVILNFDKIHIFDRDGLFCIATCLFDKWMQPLYFRYNQLLSVNIIIEIISKLFDTGYIVVGMTCNLSESKDILNQLGIGVESTKQCYFKHPSNENYKVFVFPDEYELYTLIRKQFLQHGFIVNGKRVNKQCIEEMLAVNKKARYSCKISDDIVDDSKSDKKTSLLMKQLFSKTVARKMLSYGQDGLLSNDWKETSSFFEMINKWTILFNGKEGYCGIDKPYGLALDIQDDVLDKIEKLMASTIVDCLEAPTCFQEQVILRCESLRELLVYLKESFSIKDYPISYILTYRLGSEMQKKVVAYLIDLDNANMSQNLLDMSQTKFQTKLRRIILGKYLSDFSCNQIWRILDPCLIDFHEKSDSALPPDE